MSQPQTYATHRRFDPLFHYVLLPFFLLAAVASVWHLVKRPGLPALGLVLLAFALALLTLLVRGYALKLQDRLIRLEEQLRMARLLAPDLLSRTAELTVRQFVALRFASDGELADRVREALEERLEGEAIKQRIQAWRPDTFRV